MKPFEAFLNNRLTTPWHMSAALRHMAQVEGHPYLVTVIGWEQLAAPNCFRIYSQREALQTIDEDGVLSRPEAYSKAQDRFEFGELRPLDGKPGESLFIYHADLEHAQILVSVGSRDPVLVLESMIRELPQTLRLFPFNYDTARKGSWTSSGTIQRALSYPNPRPLTIC